jgi:hypothetical protein
VRYLGIEVNDALELAEQTRVIAGVEGRVGRRRRSLTGQLRSFAFPNGLLEAVIPVPNGGFPRETKLRERGGSADAQIPGSPAPEAVQDLMSSAMPSSATGLRMPRSQMPLWRLWNATGSNVG